MTLWDSQVNVFQIWILKIVCFPISIKILENNLSSHSIQSMNSWFLKSLFHNLLFYLFTQNYFISCCLKILHSFIFLFFDDLFFCFWVDLDHFIILNVENCTKSIKNDSKLIIESNRNPQEENKHSKCNHQLHSGEYLSIGKSSTFPSNVHNNEASKPSNVGSNITKSSFQTFSKG